MKTTVNDQRGTAVAELKVQEKALPGIVRDWFPELFANPDDPVLADGITRLASRLQDGSWLNRTLRDAARDCILESAKARGLLVLAKRKRGRPPMDRSGKQAIRESVRREALAIRRVRKLMANTGSLGAAAVFVDAIVSDIPANDRKKVVRSILYGPEPPSRVAAKIWSLSVPPLSHRELMRDK